MVLFGLLSLCTAARIAHGQGGHAGGRPELSRAELRECLVAQYQNQAAGGTLDAQRAELKTAESGLVSYSDAIDSKRVTLDKSSQVAVDAFNADVARFREVAARQEAAVASFRERVARHSEKIDAWNTRCAGREYRDRDRVAVESEIAEASTRVPKKFTYGGDSSQATNPATVLELQRGAQTQEAFVTRSLPPKTAAVAPSTDQTETKDDTLADTLYSFWFKSDDEGVAYKAAKAFVATFPSDARARAVRLWMSKHQALEHSAASGTFPNSAGATAGANATGVHDVPNERNTLSEQKPQIAVEAESQRRTELYTTWESNKKENHVVAYNAGKEFVAANQSDPRTPIVRSWVKSYEKVVAGSTVAAQPLARGTTDAGLLEEAKQWLIKFLEHQGSFEFASKTSSGDVRRIERKLIGARFERCNLIRSDATLYHRSGLFSPSALFVRTESIPLDLVDLQTISFVPANVVELPSAFSAPHVKVTMVGNEKLVIGSWSPHTGTLDSPVPSKTAPDQPYTTNVSAFPIKASDEAVLLNALRTLVRLCAG